MTAPAASGARGAVALYALAAALLLLLLTLSSQLGGYGLIPWSWHPVLMTLALALLMPLALDESDALVRACAACAPRALRLDTRGMHGLVNALAFVLIIAGWRIADEIHEAKGKAHLPALSKGPARLLHVYGGFLFLFLMLVQSLSGAARLLPVLSPVLARVALLVPHARAGKAVWAGGLVVLGLGVYIMLVEGTRSYAATAAGIAALAALAWRVRSSGSGGGGGMAAASTAALAPPAEEERRKSAPTL